MEHKEIFRRLPAALLPWYERNKRDLPWRRDKEPYHIWLSEIMLQQTRVEAVRGYYTRFLEALPTVEALANAGDEVLHKLWEGLGYYSRVRNLKKAAQAVVRDGHFPTEHRAVLALPGIGPYTAGAICSICYDLPTPAVDGNVLRVISRLTDDDTPVDDPVYKKKVTEALENIYPREAGDFTQALMELGATVCGPNRSPRCGECPCREFCLGFAGGTAEGLPVKLPKKSKRLEEYTVFILSCGGKYALEKRPDQGLLAGLWQFPNISGKKSIGEAVDHLADRGLAPRDILRQSERNHIFTHIRWEMRGYWVEVEEAAGGYQWLTADEINKHSAIPTAFRQFWEETQNMV